MNTKIPFNNLLVIDDNEAIHEDFKKIFAPEEKNTGLDDLDAEFFGQPAKTEHQRIEYGLSFATQGEEGYQLLEKSLQDNVRIGVAFVDMRMPPGWDGVETIARLWELDPELQVVICTAFSDHSWEEITDRLGISDKLLILKKPFDEVEVIQLAASLTEKRRLLAASRERTRILEDLVADQGTELNVAQKDAELLISSISSMLVSLDENGIVTRWNPIAADLFDIPAYKAIGAPFKELPVQWKDWDGIAKSLRECAVIAQKQKEFQFTDNKGVMRTLSMMICPILNDATSKSRLMLAADITTQHQMKLQLDQAQRLESVGQLAAGVAHEINTPMQYIGDNIRYVAKSFQQLEHLLNVLPLLADPDITDEQLIEFRRSMPQTMKLSKVKNSLRQIPEALVDSITGVETVSKIVAAMKEFSHPGSEQKTAVCVNKILESTITVAKNEWKYVAEVETDLAENMEKIDAFPSELNQAFLNIVVNAAHAIGDRVAQGDFKKGLIKIATHSLHEHVVITIQDNGGGIPYSIQDKIFEPFFTTKDVGKGTGQGLAIAFSVVVKKHGGKIWLDVEKDMGTTFNIALPRQVVAPVISPLAGESIPAFPGATV